ncbi:MAG: hypothetical protein NTX48_06495 [Planctomycetales bacterium]|nr:hypothetical protein [Planctomycetales bacterium]
MNTRDLLVDSGNVQLGQPSDSKLIELILATDPELQMPPKDQARLSVAEVAVLKKWIADDVPWDDGFSFAPVAWDPPLKPRRPFRCRFGGASGGAT